MASGAARFELKVGEIFKLGKGVSGIEADLKHHRKARLSNLPSGLLERLLPLLASYQSVEINAHDETQRAAFSGRVAGMRAVRSQWYQMFLGQKLGMGEILTPASLYHVLWEPGGQIRRVFAVTDPTFVEFVTRKNFMMRLEDEQIYATVYDRQEGLEVIRQKARHATVFRACVLPPSLLSDLLPYALKSDYRIITSRRDPIAIERRKDGDVRSGSEAKIYFIYGGEEASVGSLRLNHELFSIFWRGEKIFNVMRYDNLIFGNYLSKVFDTAWKYSKKLDAVAP